MALAALARPLETSQETRAGGGASYPRIPPAAATRPLAAPGALKSAQAERDALLLRHLPQVHLVARKVWERVRFAVDLDDLIGYGTIGLVKAVEKYDPSRGILLKTYAEYRIRGAILDGLRGMDWLSRAARSAERRDRALLEESARESSGGEKTAPCLAEPAAGNRSARRPLRMRTVFSGGNLADLERLAALVPGGSPLSEAPSSPERIYERRERCERLRRAITKLPPRHQEIMDLYYCAGLTMKEIADRLHVHESRVSQLHGAALRTLRRGLAELGGSGAHRPAQSTGRAARASRIRRTASQSSAVSTPTVSCGVSAT